MHVWVMNDLSVTIRRELSTRLPAALKPHVICFAFSDEHPSDERPFDVVVCTSKGEVIELFRRLINASTRLGDGLIPREITLYRNKEAVKFYLVSTFERIYVISSRSNLEIYKLIENVERFVIDDQLCNGTACVRLWYNDDAVPVVLDESFENCGDSVNNYERQCYSNDATVDNGSTFLASLRSKLLEARHTVAVNERRYEDLLRLRQNVAHTLLLDACPNSVESVFQSCQNVHEAMGVIGPSPWLKLCNGKVVLGAMLCNETNSTTFSGIKLIVQNDTGTPVIYNTWMFSSLTSAPFWERKYSTELTAKSRASIVAVMDLPKFSIENNIQYRVIVIYEMEGSEKFLPLEKKTLSSLDTLNESFNLLASTEFDNISLLAIMASTEALTLRVLLMREPPDVMPPDIISIFLQHLKMERVSCTDNILIHRTSPYHILHGVMVLVNEYRDGSVGISSDITVFFRCKSQLASLLHLIYDGIPHRLVVSIPEATITEITKENPVDLNADLMAVDDVLMSPQNSPDERCLSMARSLLAQMVMVLQYLDDCMVSMAARKNSEVVNLIGTKIDFFSSGSCRYSEFVCKLNDEIRQGNKYFN